MELIYFLFKYALGFNIFIGFLVIYQLGKMIKSSINRRKYGGKRLETFRHKSGMKIFTLILFVLGTTFNFWMLKWINIGNVVVFQMYLLIVTIEAWRKIVIYEKGIYHMGRFVQWEEIKSIKTNKSSIRIEIKSNLLGMLVMSKVTRESELMGMIEENT